MFVNISVCFSAALKYLALGQKSSTSFLCPVWSAHRMLMIKPAHAASSMLESSAFIRLLHLLPLTSPPFPAWMLMSRSTFPKCKGHASRIRAVLFRLRPREIARKSANCCYGNQLDHQRDAAQAPAVVHHSTSCNARRRASLTTIVPNFRKAGSAHLVVR